MLLVPCSAFDGTHRTHTLGACNVRLVGAARQAEATTESLLYRALPDLLPDRLAVLHEQAHKRAHTGVILRERFLQSLNNRASLFCSVDRRHADTLSKLATGQPAPLAPLETCQATLRICQIQRGLALNPKP